MAALLASPARALPVGSRSPFRQGAAVLQARPVAPMRRSAARAMPAVQARAAKTAQQLYICVDCGYIYDGSEGDFSKLPNSYRCPVCSAPKRRFKPYTGPAGKNDQRSMNARWEKLQGGEGVASGGGGGGINGGAAAAVAVAAAAALAGLYFFLSAQYS